MTVLVNKASSGDSQQEVLDATIEEALECSSKMRKRLQDSRVDK